MSVLKFNEWQDLSGNSVTTAAELNAIGTWTSYTPTIGSPLTIGNGTVDFRYAVLNDIVFVDGTIIFGSTTAVTGSGAPSVSLPINNAWASPINRKIGYGQINDAGTATYDLWPLVVAPDTFLIFCSDSSGTYLRESAIGTTIPMTWTTGDSMHMTVIYRAA